MFKYSPYLLLYSWATGIAKLEVEENTGLFNLDEVLCGCIGTALTIELGIPIMFLRIPVIRENQ